MNAARRVDRLADRYLDPRRPYLRRHDDARRALCAAAPEAEARWRKRLALHRALVGVERASGLEDRRQAELTVTRALTTRSRWARLWWLGPLAAAAVALFVLRSPAPEESEWLARRGSPWDHEPLVGFGLGGIDDEGREYDIATPLSPDHMRALVDGDWTRLSYTNERDDLGWLFLVALRDDGIVWLTPDPHEPHSVAITTGHRVLDIETRIPAAAGDTVVFVGIFSREPVTVPAMRTALETLPTSRAASSLDLDSLAAVFDNHLRTRLGLRPGDVVQIETTRIAPRGPRQEAP